MQAEILDLQEKTFDTGEVKLNYVEGPAAGRPVLLLHGLSDWWHTWESLIPSLTGGWRVYAIDMRGHGKSGRAPRGHYRLEDYVRDAVAFLRGVIGEPAVLIGHSLGAATALYTAAAAPECVRGLILCEPPLTSFHITIDQTPHFKRWFQAVQSLSQTQTHAELLARTQAMVPHASGAALETLARHLSSVDPAAAQPALDDTIFQTGRLPETLRKVACPTAILQGEKSLGSALWDEDLPLVRANLPAATLIKFPHVGHATYQQTGTIIEQLNKMR